MKVLTWDIHAMARDFEYSIVPIGDIHVGNAGCDEEKLKQTVKFIQQTESKWIGMGDYAEFIQMNDPRFDLQSLAEWIQVEHLGDLVGAQRDRLIDIIQPIASQCIGLIEGNHERAIRKHYERDIYLEIVTAIKKAGKINSDLALGVSGWVNLKFYRTVEGRRGGSRQIRIFAHHGFVGGRLAGAKALNMQRWLWSHNADIVIFGHSHNTMVMAEAIEELSMTGKVIYRPRFGCFSGTFVRTSVPNRETYPERRGYLPLPTGGVRIRLLPYKEDPMRRIVMETFT